MHKLKNCVDLQGNTVNITTMQTEKPKPKGRRKNVSRRVQLSFFTQEFPAKLKKLREERGMSQQQLAEACGDTYDRTIICRYETGRRAPSLTSIAWIAKALDCPVAELITDPTDV